MQRRLSPRTSGRALVLGVAALGLAFAVGRSGVPTSGAPVPPELHPRRALDRVEPHQVLQIRGLNTMDAPPIDGLYVVDAGGRVDLGRPYGKVRLQGLKFEAARAAVARHIEEVVKDPKVTLGLIGWVRKPRKAVRRTKPYKVLHGHCLDIRVDPEKSLPGEPITGLYKVDLAGEVDLGPTYGKVNVAGRTLEQARKAIEKQLSTVIVHPDPAVIPLEWKNDWQRIKTVPEVIGPPGLDAADTGDVYRVAAYHVLWVRALPVLPTAPIDGHFLVEADGRVDLGPDYGKVRVGGLTLDDASAAVVKHLGRVVKNPKAWVKLAGWVPGWYDDPERKNPYRIGPRQVLRIRAMPALPGKPISRSYLVDPDGKVVLGPPYGTVSVKGLTLDQAAEAIRKHLTKVLKGPQVSVTPGGWDRDWVNDTGGKAVPASR